MSQKDGPVCSAPVRGTDRKAKERNGQKRQKRRGVGKSEGQETDRGLGKESCKIH